jgi:eukaryotic-like serine/threonine-protein kinase
MTRESLADTQAGDRFELRGQLGSGGMGVVYRVFDRARGREVALKTLKHTGGREIYRFKREFRALADLSHPNLVGLHELWTVGEDWMFTMELVDGVPFSRWVRPTPPAAADEVGPFTDEDTRPARGGGASPSPALGPLDERRLRGALYQLVDAITALHAAGKLHRDVKPSNVLVERDGRVVVLDFGLIADVDAFHIDRTHERAAVGTPSFMSPEQAADKPLTDASDWYAVGVMLYEALTGRRPFEGAAEVVLSRKQREDPPRPSEVALGVPPDLELLCMMMLTRDPMWRPDGKAILAALGREPSPATERIMQQAARGPFVGRGEELASLRRALAGSRQGCVGVLVLGRSGMGKTALVRAFLDEVSVDGQAMILEGRCYEREAVPYKALDQVVDGLTAYLVRQPRPDIDRLVPGDVAALVRLFPVLRRVPGLAGPTLPGMLPGDPVELRRRAVDALREILGEIAETRPVVIAIDDLQWGDIDGAWALAELIREPGAPRMLVIVSHRVEDVEGGEALETLRRWHQGELSQLLVGALPEEEARHLWHALGGDLSDAATLRDAAGNPLLLAEIARARAAGDQAVASVDAAVQARMARLDGDARALLHAVAVAARPLPPEVIGTAAGLDDAAGAMSTLRMERLVRVRTRPAVTVEPYHDRIREAVVAAMSGDELRRAHGGIARALAAEETGDRELMIEHWLGAGDSGRASRQAARAAREAEERFAFHRAAELYAIALLHGELDDATRCAITTRRAYTLTAAGRLVEAAVEFRAAASLTRGREKFALECKSVEQLLRAGHLDRGLAAAEELLAEVGLAMPRTWRRAVMALLIERARLRLRGLDFVERPEREVPPDVLQRLDVLWSVSSGFSFVNPIVGRVLQARLLREALAAGEPRRCVLAYGLEQGYLGLYGEKTRDRTEEILARARRGAEKLGAGDVRGYVEAAGGLGSYLAGRFREGNDRMIAGELLMRENPTEVRWQLDVCEIFRIAVLWNLGELREMLRLQPTYLRSAEERGSVYSQRGLRGWRSNAAWLIRDEPVEARLQAVKASLGRGQGEPFHLHHYYDLLAHTQIDLYERKPEDAFARVDAGWRELVDSHLLRVQLLDIEAHWLRGATAVAAARVDRGRLAIAEKAVRRLEGITSPQARVMAAQLRGGLCIRVGAHTAAVEALREAIASAELAEMAAHHAVARLRLGLLLGGAEGRTLVEHAQLWMRDQGVVAPDAFAGLLSPGHGEPA